jgi:hypothetical protein
MFAKGGDGYRDVVMCGVTITLTSGTLLSGVIQRPRSKKLGEYLNDDTKFIEIELYDGAIVQVAKTTIEQCALREVPKADQLANTIHRSDVYHPMGTLGLESLPSKEAIQQAYRARISQYHQDKYAGVNLPAEVMAYLQDMTVRINTAYTDALAMLDAQQRQAAAEKRKRAPAF